MITRNILCSLNMGCLVTMYIILFCMELKGTGTDIPNVLDNLVIKNVKGIHL